MQLRNRFTGDIISVTGIVADLYAAKPAWVVISTDDQVASPPLQDVREVVRAERAVGVNLTSAAFGNNDTAIPGLSVLVDSDGSPLDVSVSVLLFCQLTAVTFVFLKVWAGPVGTGTEVLRLPVSVPSGTTFDQKNATQRWWYPPVGPTVLTLSISGPGGTSQTTGLGTDGDRSASWLEVASAA